MAKLVFGMNQSLDGYVDHNGFAPGPKLFRHFIEEAERQAGSIYGRKMYEIMRYWDDDQPEWGADEHAFASAWRRQPTHCCTAPVSNRPRRWQLVRIHGPMARPGSRRRANHSRTPTSTP